MPTINVSGATPESIRKAAEAATQQAKTPEQKALETIQGDQFQDAISRIKYISGLHDRYSRQQAQWERQQDQQHRRDFQSDLDRALFMARLRKGSAREETRAEFDLARQKHKDFNDDLSALLNKMRIRKRAERDELSAEKEIAQQKRRDFNDDVGRVLYMNRVRRVSERNERRAIREEERVVEAEQKQRQARLHAWSRAAGRTAMVMSGVHGDFEGAVTGAGGLIGGIFGPEGAVIGEVIGEILSKVVKGLVTLPLQPGNAWAAFQGVTAPWTTLQRGSYDLARAGSFSGNTLINQIMPNDYTAPAWMQKLGVSPQDIGELMTQLSYTPRSPGEAIGLTADQRQLGLTSAYSNLRPGLMEVAMGQGLATGASTPANTQEYMTRFAAVLENAVAKGADKSRIFGGMVQTIDKLAGSGAAGISNQAVSDAFLRFMLTNAPGGRTGEMAAGSIAGTTAGLADVTQNRGMAWASVQLARQAGGLTTEDSIRKYVGETAWANADPDLRAKIVADTLKDAQAGNLYGAVQDVGPLQQVDVPFFQQQVAGLYRGRGFGPAAERSLVATATNQTLDQERYREYGEGARGDPAKIKSELYGIKSYAGTANEGDATAVMQKMGVPQWLIPKILAAAERTGQDPVKMAVIAEHESSFNPNATHVNSDRAMTTDYGLMQLNSKWAAGDLFAAGPNSRFDPDQNLVAGGMHLAAAGGDFYRYAGLTPGGTKGANEMASRYLAVTGGDVTKNIPQQANQNTALAAQATLTGSRTMFEGYSTAMVKVSEAANSLAPQLRVMADAVDALAKANPHVEMTGPPLGRPAPADFDDPAKNRLYGFHSSQ